LAGGVALNCVANSKILNEAGFDNIWIQPAAGDAGGAIGAALGYWHLGLKNSREIEPSDALMGSYLGPSYEAIEIKYYLEKNNIPYEELNLETRDIKTCELLEAGKIIGWFQGRMEFGPRALGHRSILGDARIKDMQHRMNLKVKFRESFRPFAPIVLEEDVGKIFKFKGVSPYMLFVADVNDDLREKISPADEQKFGIERLNQIRSKYPAITHVDYSARLQTVSRNRSPILHSLLTKYKERNLTSVLVNTSFNVRGEPIVCTPQDAFKCFMRTDIDALILGNFLITKDLNSHFTDELDWRKSYELD
jgi:carbamoyltransferase